MTDEIAYTCEKCGTKWGGPGIPSRCSRHVPPIEGPTPCGGYVTIGTPHLRLRILGVEGDQVRFQVAEQKWRGKDFAPWHREGVYFPDTGPVLVSMIDSMCPQFGIHATLLPDGKSMMLPMHTFGDVSFCGFAVSVQSYCTKAAEWEKANREEANRLETLKKYSSGMASKDGVVDALALPTGEKAERPAEPGPAFCEWHFRNCPTVTDKPICDPPIASCDGAFRWGYGGVFGNDSVRAVFAGRTCREVFKAWRASRDDFIVAGTKGGWGPITVTNLDTQTPLQYVMPPRKPEPLRCDECGGEGIIRSTMTSGPGQWCMACWDKRRVELAAVKEEGGTCCYTCGASGGPAGLSQWWCQVCAQKYTDLSLKQQVAAVKAEDEEAKKSDGWNAKKEALFQKDVDKWLGKCRYAEPVMIAGAVIKKDRRRDIERSGWDVKEAFGRFRRLVTTTSREWPTCRWGGKVNLSVEFTRDETLIGYYLCDRCSKGKA